MFEKILNALKSLDHKNDEHWTADGQPRLDAVKAAAGDQTVTREAVVAAAPAFNRAAAVAGTVPAVTAAPAAPTPPAAGAPPAAPPAPVAPPPVAAPKKGDPDAIKEAQEALSDANDNVAEMDQWISKAQEERKARVNRAEAAQRALDAVQPVQTNGDAIQAYLAQQRANLAARGAAFARAAAFRAEHGFHLADLLPQRAKVDSVRARRTGYGNVRPPGSK